MNAQKDTYQSSLNIIKYQNDKPNNNTINKRNKTIEKLRKLNTINNNNNNL